MTSQWPYESNDDAGRGIETPVGFPARIAAAIGILVAVTLADATPQLAIDPADKQPRPQQFVPSACGADAVARAQREVNRSRAPGPTAIS